MTTTPNPECKHCGLHQTSCDLLNPKGVFGFKPQLCCDQCSHIQSNNLAENVAIARKIIPENCLIPELEREVLISMEKVKDGLQALIWLITMHEQNSGKGLMDMNSFDKGKEALTTINQLLATQSEKEK